MVSPIVAPKSSLRELQHLVPSTFDPKRMFVIGDRESHIGGRLKKTYEPTNLSCWDLQQAKSNVWACSLSTYAWSGQQAKKCGPRRGWSHEPSRRNSTRMADWWIPGAKMRWFFHEKHRIKLNVPGYHSDPKTPVVCIYIYIYILHITYIYIYTYTYIYIYIYIT